jgi:hypothetical protein
MVTTASSAQTLPPPPNISSVLAENTDKLSLPSREPSQFDQQPRIGIAATPGRAIRVMEISSWEHVPAVLAALKKGDKQQIRLDFPDPGAGNANRESVIQAQNAIKDFFRSMHDRGFTAAFAGLPKDAQELLRGSAKTHKDLKIAVTEVYRVDADLVNDAPRLKSFVVQLVQEVQHSPKRAAILSVSAGCEETFAGALAESLAKLNPPVDLKHVKVWVGGDQSPQFGKKAFSEDELLAVKAMTVEDFLKAYNKVRGKELEEKQSPDADAGADKAKAEEAKVAESEQQTKEPEAEKRDADRAVEGELTDVEEDDLKARLGLPEWQDIVFAV